MSRQDSETVIGHLILSRQHDRDLRLRLRSIYKRAADFAPSRQQLRCTSLLGKGEGSPPHWNAFLGGSHVSLRNLSNSSDAKEY